MSIIARDNAFQYDSVLETELSRKWISVFRTRARDRFYESQVVKLISILPVATTRFLIWPLLSLAVLLTCASPTVHIPWTCFLSCIMAVMVLVGL